MWKWLLVTALILGGGCIGTGWYMQSTGKFDEWQRQFRPDLRPVTVRTAKVVRGDLVRTVNTPGKVEPRTKVEISAQVSARIVALPFREGETVKKGDVVCRLDAVDLAAALDSAKAQLKSEEARLSGARANYENARLELNRKRELHDTKDIPKAELDTAEAQFASAESGLRVAEFAIDIARANIQRAEKDLNNTVIAAPFDGVITRLDAEIGELVVVGTLNTPGSVFMEIADLSTMLVKARVDEANIAPVKKGQKAVVFVNAYPDTPLTGTVDHVGLKRLEDRDGTAYFETDIILELPEGLLLRSGLTASADIQVETFRDVLKAPSQAAVDRRVDELPTGVAASPLVDRAKRYARVVYIFEPTTGEKVRPGEGRARPVAVKTGASDLTDTLILDGLEEGATVIAGPFKALSTLKADQLVVLESAAEKKEPAAAAAAE